jgi:hypothetical protein
MSFPLLAEVFGKRGFTYKQSESQHNFAHIWEIVDGRSVPVYQVNLVDGSFLELPYYKHLKTKTKIKLSEAEAEYDRRFKRWYKKSH